MNLCALVLAESRRHTVVYKMDSKRMSFLHSCMTKKLKDSS